jgi:hypothetical protein
MFGDGERGGSETVAITPEMLAAMLDYMPLRSLLGFGVAPEDIGLLLDRLNNLP